MNPDVSHKATVLVVDDTPSDIFLMSSLLKEVYTVVVANNGEKALKIVADNPPDLILLDIMMPGIDGYEVCRRLKADWTIRHIPVIFLTAKTEVGDESQGLELGAVDYITKPISPPIVLARIKTHLALKASADALRDEIALRQIAQETLEHHHLRVEELNSELEQRVAVEVRKNREKDLALNAELAIRVAVEVEKNRQKDLKLMQSERMSTIGKLAAGVAHEINNPMCFIFRTPYLYGDCDDTNS